MQWGRGGGRRLSLCWLLGTSQGVQTLLGVFGARQGRAVSPLAHFCAEQEDSTRSAVSLVARCKKAGWESLGFFPRTASGRQEHQGGRGRRTAGGRQELVCPLVLPSHLRTLYLTVTLN